MGDELHSFHFTPVEVQLLYGLTGQIAASGPTLDALAEIRRRLKLALPEDAVVEAPVVEAPGPEIPAAVA